MIRGVAQGAMLAARRARGDAVVDERALGRRVPREPRSKVIGVAGGSPNGRAVREGRGVGRAHVAAIVSRARGRRADSRAATGAAASRARGAARRAGVGAVERARRAGPGARARRGSSAWSAASLGWVAVVAVVVAVVLAIRPARRLRCCGCCTRCAFGGRGRGRRSTRASRPVRSGARACGRSRACPPATCSRAGSSWAVRRRSRRSARASRPRVFGRVRFGCCAIRGMRRRRAC